MGIGSSRYAPRRVSATMRPALGRGFHSDSLDAVGRSRAVNSEDETAKIGAGMGILDVIRRDKTTDTARSALREVRQPETESGAVTRLVGMFRDVGIDGKFTYASAEAVAHRAQRGRRTTSEKAIKRVVRRHRRGVTLGGFATGFGGFVTLPIMLPLNVVEFYIQATRMVGATAAIRGYDLEDDEVRARVLTALLGEESGDVLDHVGLGPVTGFATRQVAKRLPAPQMSQIANAIGVRMLRKFGLRSFRLFGKAIPGLGAVIGAISDRRQLRRIAEAAQRDFPAIES